MPGSRPTLFRCGYSSTSFCCGTRFQLFYLLLLSFWDERRIQALLQIVTDLVLVTLVVYATGGVDSSLNFLYPLVIIVACILLPRVWAYLTGALAFILYVAVLELTYFEVIPSYSTSHPGMGALQAIIFVNLFGYLAVAYLAGLLAAKLRQVDVKLKYTSGALEDLQALHENIIQSISGGLIKQDENAELVEDRSSAPHKCLAVGCRLDTIGAPVEKPDAKRLLELSNRS